MDYKKLLIQQQTFSGTTYTNVGVRIDTQAMFGVVCQEFPFKYLPETKDLPKHDWYDEDGDDVYIPSNGLRFAAYDMEVKFLYVGTEADMAGNIKDFIDFICGRINYILVDNVVTKITTNVTQNVMLSVYDEYTKTGRRGVFVKEVSNELLAYDDRNGEYFTGYIGGVYVENVYVGDVIGVFKVKFRVTDPVYEVTALQ